MGPIKKFLNYDKEQMMRALEDVARGKPVATAARDHGVPRVTLLYKVKNKTPVDRRMGPATILKPDEEKIIVDWIQHMTEIGSPVSKTQVLDRVQHLIEILKRDTIFKNGRPGKSWMKAFLRRNPTISLHMRGNATKSRTQEALETWYNEVYNHLVKQNRENILQDPSRVFNGDEISFFLNPKGNEIAATKEENRVISDDKECLTVLITANAVGDLAPPSIIFKPKNNPLDIFNSIPPMWGVGRSETGWMNSSLFHEYLTDVFHPWLLKKEICLPVILVADGHICEQSEFYDRYGIIPVPMHSNATHIPQPVDVSIFQFLMGKWMDKIHAWKTLNIANPMLERKHFASLLEEALRELPPSYIVDGFKKCGLVTSSAISDVKMSAPPEELHRGDDQKIKRIEAALSVIEEKVGEEKLKIFRLLSEVPNEHNDKSLFELWKQLKTEVKLLKCAYEP